RQSGGNLLLLGQNEEAMQGIVAGAIVSLAGQSPAGPEGGRFYVVDGAAAGSDAARLLEQLVDTVGQGAHLVRPRELPSVIGQLAQEVERRQSSGEPGAAVFVIVYGLQKLRELRRGEDDFGFSRGSAERPPDPSKQFAAILR